MRSKHAGVRIFAAGGQGASRPPKGAEARRLAAGAEWPAPARRVGERCVDELRAQLGEALTAPSREAQDLDGPLGLGPGAQEEGTTSADIVSEHPHLAEDVVELAHGVSPLVEVRLLNRLLGNTLSVSELGCGKR